MTVKVPKVDSGKNRRSFIEHQMSLNEASCTLEFGALDYPTYRRPDFNVKYVDYASKEDLHREHTNNPRYSLDKLVDVDYIGVDSIDCKFDLVIANHVIEHIPDTISWINTLSRLLKPDGKVFLAIPDKRFTFDIVRRETNFIDMLRMNREQVKKPDFYHILEHLYYHKDVKVADVWTGDAVDKISKMRFSPVAAVESATINARKDYASVHCHVFTKESFEQTYNIICHDLGLVDLVIEKIEPVIDGSNEFHVLLSAK